MTAFSDCEICFLPPENQAEIAAIVISEARIHGRNFVPLKWDGATTVAAVVTEFVETPERVSR